MNDVLQMIAGASITAPFGSDYLISDTGAPVVLTDMCLQEDPYRIDAG